MSDRKYKLTRGIGLSVPLSEADQLLREADGNCALLYLYILRSGGEFSENSAARELKRTEREIGEAVNRLRAMGLVSGAEGRLRGADELPDYRAEEIAERSSKNDDFKAVVEETQTVFGRMLTGAEMKTLFGIYDYLNLPAEVMLMLVYHCVEEHRETAGEGRLPSMRRIEKEAYEWSDNEVLNLEGAERYIRRKRERKEQSADIAKAVQIRDRVLSATEKKYVDSWIDMGFMAEAIGIAYDKTVVKTGQRQWKYMDSIIRSWHGKGLHTPEEIEAGDSRPKKSRTEYTAPGGKEAPEQKVDLERMKKILERVKNS